MTGLPKNQKAIPGWSEYVEEYRQASIFWHKLWVDNGKPRVGVVADVRRKTRARYHRAIKFVRKHEEAIRSDKMAEALANNRQRDMWREAKKCKHRTTSSPSVVDGVSDTKGIADVFAKKFSNLYSSVPYNEDEMYDLERDILNEIAMKCICEESSCNSFVHCILHTDIEDAVNHLKCMKTDGHSGMFSDHIINGTKKLYIYLAILFTAMLRHGVCPEDMLLGTLSPIPKGKRGVTTNSDNFRGITLSSICGKVMDWVVLLKHSDILVTSEMQFGFKKHSSTTLCSAMVLETASYYVNNDSYVYSVFLDATKAFDRVHYCKLFRVLLDKNFCPVYARMLLHMYVNQRVRIKWRNEHSQFFKVANGVKQGGVLSPILFGIYMDTLLIRLNEKDIGCHLGSKYAGCFAYADDVVIMAPTVSAARQMITICEQFSQEYQVTFNGKKSQLLVFGDSSNKVPDPKMCLNGNVIPRVSEVLHLGHVIRDNVYKADVTRIVGDFSQKTNIFLADFKHTSSLVRSKLFFSHCCSFYGIQLVPMSGSVMNQVYTAWRVALRRVLRLPTRTHGFLLPLVANVLPPDVWLAKRYLSFYDKGCKSGNSLVKYVFNVMARGKHSVLGMNVRLVKHKYRNISQNDPCIDNCDDSAEENIALACQVLELISMRDSVDTSILSVEQCNFILEDICT